MRAIDALAIAEYRIPASILMEHAGCALAQALMLRDTRALFTIFCGPGNNGGDGLVCLRHLHTVGRKARAFILPPGPNGYGELVRANLEHAKRAHCAVEEMAEETLLALKPEGVALDCLLGTGSAGGPRGLLALAVEVFNKFEKRYAADIPTGLNADTGAAAGVCVNAQETFCLGLPKTGLVAEAARPFTGAVSVLDIGFPREAIARVLGL